MKIKTKAWPDGKDWPPTIRLDCGSSMPTDVYGINENGGVLYVRHDVHEDDLKSLSAKLPNEVVERIAEKYYDQLFLLDSTHIQQAIHESLSLVRGEDLCDGTGACINGDCIMCKLVNTQMELEQANNCLTELMEDKKRLDWFNEHYIAMRTRVVDDGEDVAGDSCDYDVAYFNLGNTESEPASDIRTAISTAMGKE